MKLSTEQINILVNELVAFEPSLSGRERALTQMIVKLADAKPEVIFDETFRGRLRAEIMELAREQASTQTIFSNLKYNFIHMINLKKISYALAGVAVLILIAVPAAFLSLNRDNLIATRQKTGKKLALETKINKVQESAFGNLRSTAESTAPAVNTRPQGGGGGAENAALGVRQFGLGGGGGGIATADSAKLGIMPPYELKNYRFIYKGKEFSVPSDKLDVLKQIKGAQVSVNMSDLISGLNFGLAELGSFTDLAVQNISLVQKGENGYIISVMPEEGAISISQNWISWPQSKCGNDVACLENQRVTLSDIPSDTELISITDAFLAEHNIDRSAYGEPEVSPGYNFRLMYEASTDRSNFYFPESIDVVYPLKLDGKYVYDEWNGAKQGMVVSVQAKQKKVSNLYNLTLQNYQASAYEMETDVKKILAYAEQGGINTIQYGVETKTEELTLTDPELAYIRYYNYKDGISEELLIPAYVFPIQELPKDPNFYRKSIVIPLAVSVLAERQAQVVPVLLETDSVSGPSGTATAPAPADAVEPKPAPEPMIEAKTLQ